MLEAIIASGFRALAVTAAHSAAVADLPDYFNDPFDRLLNAEAFQEPIILLTANDMLLRYSGHLIPRV